METPPYRSSSRGREGNGLSLDDEKEEKYRYERHVQVESET